MKNQIIFFVLIASLLGSCNFIQRTFNKKKIQREYEAKRIADSIHRADSILAVEAMLREKEQAKIDSIRMAEEAALKNKINKYHVIGGSFKMNGNAQTFSKKMECEGYNTKIIDGKSGFTYVSIGAFDTFASAANMVKQIRDEGKYIVWIHHPN